MTQSTVNPASKLGVVEAKLNGRSRKFSTAPGNTIDIWVAGTSMFKQ